MNSQLPLLNLYKKLGETPYERVARFRAENPVYKDLSLTYAGRLDPMAEGVLLVVVGDEIKNKEKYIAMDKEYSFEILWGFETDTYDILGKVVDSRRSTMDIAQNIENFIPKYVGKIKQPYPPYSSKPVQGKPLLMWAREGKLNQITIPVADVEVSSLKVLGHRKISSIDLENFITGRIALTHGDFRQKQITEKWQEEMIKYPLDNFLVTSMSLQSSSGTYVRGIAHALGQDLGCGAIALTIVREKVGEFGIENSVGK
ncbi:MAG: hypothetical protein HQ402_00850 [Parcubacteria group bacterium]|nr:hypothetical protein [Parcubacteria group bacterium]